MKRGFLNLSWGESGGVYVRRNRLCLGRVALTWWSGIEFDDMLRAYVEKSERSARTHA